MDSKEQAEHGRKGGKKSGRKHWRQIWRDTGIRPEPEPYFSAWKTKIEALYLQQDKTAMKRRDVGSEWEEICGICCVEIKTFKGENHLFMQGKITSVQEIRARFEKITGRSADKPFQQNSDKT
jgi:hypothetical protein